LFVSYLSQWYHVKWEDLDAIVFETRAMKCLIKMIEEEDIVTVIGSPGCGKTTAIHHVALRLKITKF
jgi:ABC-type phosphate transport system ATPase subunit